MRGKEKRRNSRESEHVQETSTKGPGTKEDNEETNDDSGLQFQHGVLLRRYDSEVSKNLNRCD